MHVLNCHCMQSWDPGVVMPRIHNIVEWKYLWKSYRMYKIQQRNEKREILTASRGYSVPHLCSNAIVWYLPIKEAGPAIKPNPLPKFTALFDSGIFPPSHLIDDLNLFSNLILPRISWHYHDYSRVLQATMALVEKLQKNILRVLYPYTVKLLLSNGAYMYTWPRLHNSIRQINIYQPDRYHH